MAGVRFFILLCIISLLLFTNIVDCRNTKSRRRGSRTTSRAKASVAKDCILQYDSTAAEHIHPITAAPEGDEFLYPSMEGKVRILRIADGKGVIAACPGPRNRLLLNGLTSSTISCRGGSLYYGSSEIRWSQLGCHGKPRPTLDKTSISCGSRSSSSSSSLSLQGVTYDIRWPISKGVAIPQISICFNEDTESALFTHHKINGRFIDAKVIEPDRPSFKKGRMFSISANSAYGKRDQKALFLELLGDLSHLTAKKQHYLARGHLSPDSDFLLEPEQDATYFYVNVVPQWQAINNGNWKSLENSIRELAEKRRGTLEVWTGIYDVLHLPNTSGDPVELFLGLSQRKKVIPVPALMWKVVYDPEAKTAIAIVVVNDVRGFGSGSRPSGLFEPPCHDLCPEVAWVDWDTTDVSSGRTFCCSVQDIRKTIPTIPYLRRRLGVLYS